VYLFAAPGPAPAAARSSLQQQQQQRRRWTADWNNRHRQMTAFDPLHRHTHIHPFNGPLSTTSRVSQYQKGKTNLDFTEARDSEWQWHQLGYMQVCTSLQTDNHASTPPLSFFTGRMLFLPPNQQRQSIEGTATPQSIQGAIVMWEV